MCHGFSFKYFMKVGYNFQKQKITLYRLRWFKLFILLKVKHENYGWDAEKVNRTGEQFRVNEVDFKVIYKRHQNCSKTHFMIIQSIFCDHHMLHKNWPNWLGTSLGQVWLFFANLIHNPDISLLTHYINTLQFSQISWHMSRHLQISLNTDYVC